MDGFSIWHWVIVLIVVGVLFFVGRYGALIARRAGLPALWGILFAVPVLNVVSLWYVALAKWPATRRVEKN